ncbi:MAG: hypothetical protein A2413_10310 [Treponema sp. RIFOXYC1_FULL_61_9]|nr:MAG: hypothetical protein A2413_10310 [Treponema sp. RIFOXYC1_FULL_61_9]
MPVLFLAGDSTCATNGADTWPQTGWGQRLTEFVQAPWRVENRAVNGRSTKSFLDEGRFGAILSELRPGDFVMIQFGHNDQKSEDPVRFAAAEGPYRDNLRLMVRLARERGGIPVVLSPVARRRFGADGVLVATHGEYPAAARMTAAETGVPFIDMEARTDAWLRSLGDAPSRRFFMHLEPGEFPAYPDGLADDTHFRIEGADEVARMVAGEGRALGLAPFGFAPSG